MADENGHDEDDAPDDEEHELEDEFDDMFDFEMDSHTQIFLEMRKQNIALLKIAAQVAGLSGRQGPIKPGDLRQALKSLWETYAEFYTWVDPEADEDDDEQELEP
jgi:hypothetical protein